MKAIPAPVTCLSLSRSWIAAGAAYALVAHSPASHTNGSPPRACLAKKFHEAWAAAAAAMRANAVGLTGLLSGARRTWPSGLLSRQVWDAGASWRRSVADPVALILAGRHGGTGAGGTLGATTCCPHRTTVRRWRPPRSPTAR